MRTLIVDHEPYARANLRHLCEADAGIHEVEVAECGASALELIRVNNPDLLLLDVDLKDMSGFDVLHSLNQATRPAVIMLAAHNQHGAKAPRGGAIDYLTKPVAANRLASAIAKVREGRELALAGAQPRLPAQSNQVGRRQSPMHLMGESGRRLYFLAVKDVDYFEACGNYVVIHIGDQKYMRRDTLKRLAAAFREQGFEWIQRSTLINLGRVAFAEKLGRGALVFTLTTGTRLVSRAKIYLEPTSASSTEDEP